MLQPRFPIGLLIASTTHQMKLTKGSSHDVASNACTAYLDPKRRAPRGAAAGTKSTPPGCHGWQRARREMASQPPLAIPWSRTAVAAY
jgi:hypothetical protein